MWEQDVTQEGVLPCAEVVVVRGDLPLGCVLGAAVAGLVVVVGAVVTAVARGA